MKSRLSAMELTMRRCHKYPYKSLSDWETVQTGLSKERLRVTIYKFWASLGKLHDVY